MGKGLARKWPESLGRRGTEYRNKLWRVTTHMEANGRVC